MNEFERDGVKYVAREQVGCDGCAFLGAPGDCSGIPKCDSDDRDDSRSIIWIRAEHDPHGRDAHTPGAKLDAGKVRPALVLGGFARALLEVSKVGTYGAAKYTENGWQEVPNGIGRYDDAGMRHWLQEHAGQQCDPDTELTHAAHAAWNALARLDLMLREKETRHA